MKKQKTFKLFSLILMWFVLSAQMMYAQKEVTSATSIDSLFAQCVATRQAHVHMELDGASLWLVKRFSPELRNLGVKMVELTVFSDREKPCPSARPLLQRLMTEKRFTDAKWLTDVQEDEQTVRFFVTEKAKYFSDVYMVVYFARKQDADVVLMHVRGKITPEKVEKLKKAVDI